MNQPTLLCMFIYSLFTMLQCTMAQDKNEALFTAIKQKDLAAVQQLIQQGAAVNQPDTSGFSPLLWATRESSLEIVQCLVENGAAVNVVEATNKNTPLLLAAFMNRPAVVRHLLEQGAAVNHINIEKWGVLHAAVIGYNNWLGYSAGLGWEWQMWVEEKEKMEQAHLQTLRALLAEGADTTLQDKEGKTVLD